VRRMWWGAVAPAVLAALMVAGCGAADEISAVPSTSGTAAMVSTAVPSTSGTAAVVSTAVPSTSGTAVATTAPSSTGSTWWRPPADLTWQWQLRGTVGTTVDVGLYDVDLADTPQTTIDALHAAGRHVLCYFSAGSSENWRTDDAQFAPSDRGAPLDGWPGENWLLVTSPTVRAVMAQRLDLAVRKGCDGVEPDNVDGYANDNGLGITADQQLAYDRWVFQQAHRRGLAVALKNDLDQIPQLVGDVDLAVNEQCHEFGECDRYAPFLAAGKPVLNAEYAERYRTDSGPLCAEARQQGLHTLVLPLELDGSFGISCDR
jgi:hypothetical protein